MTEWFENKDFWERFEPFLFHHIRSPEETKREIAALVPLLNLRKGDHVLDLCCGPGRHTIPLAKQGLNMTGVDITQSYLKRAGQEAKKNGVSVKLVKEDIRRYRKPEAFDAAINMFSSFGYFRDPHHDDKVLQNLLDSLKPKGRFLLDLMGREVLKRSLRERTWYHDEESTSYLLQTAVIKKRWDYIENKWTWIQGTKQKTYTFSMRIYSGPEIREILQKAGFAKVTLYGDFGGSPYDGKAERLIAVAVKT